VDGDRDGKIAQEAGKEGLYMMEAFVMGNTGAFVEAGYCRKRDT